MDIPFLPFSNNIALSVFSYVLGNVLATCNELSLYYLDDIMIFFRTWEEHLKHLEAVFKQLEAADVKFKCSKCEFFKTKVHYLGFHIDVNGV